VKNIWIEKFILKCDWIEEGESWSIRNVYHSKRYHFPADKYW